MKYKRIVVTGGSGQVGKSLKKIMPNATYLSSKDFDLTNQQEVKNMFDTLNPDCIIHCASKCGGIISNLEKPAEYFDENILLNTFIIKEAYKRGVERLISVGSTCAYPDVLPDELYPLKEELLHFGPPSLFHFSYAMTKRAMISQIEAYNKQYGIKYQYLTPSNIYGENDKYDYNSHFIADLIKKIHIAKKNGNNSIKLYGSGKCLRQFMHSDSLAYVIRYCLENDIYDNMNVSSDENLSINQMAEIALVSCDAKNISIEYDLSIDGQYRKDVSCELLKKNIPSFKPISFEDGIRQTYKKAIELNKF